MVLFLHSVADPLDEGVVLDLALLDELKGLCEGLGAGAGSEGARRVREIVDGMGRVAWEIVKRAARRRKRGPDIEGEGDAGERESVKSKRLRSGGEREGEDEGQEPGVEGEVEGEEEETGGGRVAGAELLNLENVPQNFEWEQWDQWLEDAPFDLE